MNPVAISVKGVSKKYMIGKQKDGSLRGTLTSLFSGRKSSVEDFWALKNVSFDIQRGDVVGVIGKNGAGKSTLLKILSQITRPTQGQIEINGRVASLLEVGTGFHPELTGRENVYLNGTILGMTRKEVASKFDEIVAFSGIEKFIDTPVKYYSSGMYVRLAFAVAAHLEPEILIIDEVLAVGDTEFQKKCLGKMRDVAGEGRTVIFVSHDLGAVKQLCNKGILMRNGEKVFGGIIKDTISEYGAIFRSNELEFDLSDYSARARGNKFAVIEFIKLNHRILSPKDRLEVSVNTRVNDMSILNKKIDLAFFIFDEFQSCIYHLNSTALRDIKYFEKTNELTFLIESLNLSKGVYSIGIHLSSNLVEFDYIENGITIEVDNNDFFDSKSIFVGKVFKDFKLI